MARICLLLLVTACFRPVYEHTACGPAGECPRALVCVRGFCEPAGDGVSDVDAASASDGSIEDAVLDSSIDDGTVGAACSSGYAPVGGSQHLYKRIPDASWDNAARDCKLTGAQAYLSIPDDAAELANIVAIATTTPVWVGIDDKQQRDTFVTQKNAPANFLPWDVDQPNQDPPAMECVRAVSASKIATDRCGNTHAVVCECEP